MQNLTIDGPFSTFVPDAAGSASRRQRARARSPAPYPIIVVACLRVF